MCLVCFVFACAFRRTAIAYAGVVPGMLLAFAILGHAVLAGELRDGDAAKRAHQLAIVQAQIHRYGCDKPRYATSVAGCRTLNARAAELSQTLPKGPSDAAKPHSAPDGAAPPVGAPPRSDVPKVTLAVPDLAPPNTDGDKDLATRRLSYSFSWRTSPYESYRTVCVRLCDGFYYPMSYAAGPQSFADEDRQCQARCGTPARLFYQPTGSDSSDNLVGLDGRAYADLPHAFRYRSQYVADCRCKPEPWSPAAHAEYERRAYVEAMTPAQRSVEDGLAGAAHVMAGGDAEVAENDEPPAVHLPFAPRPRPRPLLHPREAEDSAADERPRHPFFFLFGGRR